MSVVSRYCSNHHCARSSVAAVSGTQFDAATDRAAGGSHHRFFSLAASSNWPRPVEPPNQLISKNPCIVSHWNVARDRAKYIMLVGGLTFAALLMTRKARLLPAFWTTSHMRNMRASIWVVDPKVTDQ